MSEQLDLVVRADRVVTADGVAGRAVGVRHGVVVAVEPRDADLSSAEVVELGEDEVLMPGVVDSHVHVNDPGRTHWEGFVSATRAAAAGGVTTVVDMPLNSIPPTVDVAALEVKRKTAEPQAFVDVGFWGGAVPGNLADLRPLHAAGVFGFKCFLPDSGVDEFPPLDPVGLEAAMRELRTFDGLLIVHAEDPHALERAPSAQGSSYAGFLSSRPRSAEDRAVARVVELSRRTGCRVHVLHVSSGDTLPAVRAARRDGVRITAETCPHYLSFCSEEIPDGATPYKCCPPIRGSADRDRLWRGLREGDIDLVVSDHSPSTVELKCLDTGDFGAAWGGISSLQLGLPAVWTQARARGFDLSHVARWMCEGPARQTGMRRKGRIEVGYDADFGVFAPDDSFTVEPHELHHKNAVTPYAGSRLTGVVRDTWLRGRKVDVDAPPRGRLLTRGEA
jgi:allantoinase